MALERDAALPGNEIVLAEQLGLGGALAAGHFNTKIEQLLGASGYGGLAGDDAARIEVDDVGHALGERCVGGDFDDGSDRVAGWSAETGREEDEVGTGSGLRGDALHVAAGSAQEAQTRRGCVLREVEDIAHWSHAAFARRACGFYCVGGETVFDVA